MARPSCRQCRVAQYDGPMSSLLRHIPGASIKKPFVSPELASGWSGSDLIVIIPGRRNLTVRTSATVQTTAAWPLSAEQRRRSSREPVRFATRGVRRYWLFKSEVYESEDARLTADDVRALVNETENRRRLKLEKAHALQAMRERLDSRARREPLAQEVKLLVWQRDGGRCVQCGEQRDLEFDHIIPISMGGANTVRNLQLLCERCNRRKGATLG